MRGIMSKKNINDIIELRAREIELLTIQVVIQKRIDVINKEIKKLEQEAI